MQNVVRDGNYGHAKDTQKIYSKYIYNRVTIFDEWIKRISPSFLLVVKIWFSIKKKRKREERILQETGKVKSNETIWKNLVELGWGSSTSWSRDLFFFFIFTSKRWKNRRAKGWGGRRVAKPVRKNGRSPGGTMREKRKKKWGGGEGGRWRSERGFNEAGAHPMALMTLINCTKDGDQPLCTSHGNTSETSRKFC